MNSFACFHLTIYRYRPSISVEFVQKELGFANKQECIEYLGTMGTVYTAKNKLEIETKNSLPNYLREPGQSE